MALCVAVFLWTLQHVRRNIRPVDMAQCNPLVFWNLVRLFDGDLDVGLASCLPGVDLSFLRHRERPLSAKALENKRQREEREARRSQKLKLADGGAIEFDEDDLDEDE
uniref:Uncharacterized protein n=1 Tax=Vitrella brassicaformis TaxID=1169539 RepID=A0A7S1K430_9ALVE|mmetsp:Transcript_37466/g.94005  ORF Transcript_37466/g.94005 Transcript_37466/m.94005 type:complete len:108 (+) Transcript_37466:30-353(+)